MQCYSTTSGIDADGSFEAADAPKFGNVGLSKSAVLVSGIRLLLGGDKGLGKSSMEVLKSQVIKELSQYCGRIDPSPVDLMSWPASVVDRWKGLNGSKSSEELGVCPGIPTDDLTFAAAVKVYSNGGR